MKIRNYKPSDRSAVEHIQFETGFLGKSLSPLLSNANLNKDQVKYYVEKEPKSIFVLEHNKKVVGYVLGCLDDKNYNEILTGISKFFLNLFRSVFLPKKDRIYWTNQFFNLFKMISGKSEELKLKTPKNAGHLHINLLPEARGRGHGTKLIKKFEAYAKSKGVKTIHARAFQTRLNPNTSFWYKNGYKEFSKVKSLMWHWQYPDEEIFVVCYVKELK